MNEKKLYIFAGVNGAGKSTLYRLSSIHYETFDFGERINTDEIVNQIGDWRNPKDQIMAARIALTKRKEYIEQGISFNQETTLTGNSILKAIEEAKKNGYKIIMSYVGVENPEIAKERVKIRVGKGGHDIPNEIIEKRYYEILKNLEKIAPLCDNLIIYDNSQKKHIEVLEKKDNTIKYLINEYKIPNWVKEIKVVLEKQLENEKNLSQQIAYNPLTGHELKTLKGYELPKYDTNQWISKVEVEKNNLKVVDGSATTVPVVLKKDDKLITKDIEFYNIAQLDISKEFKKEHFKDLKIEPKKEQKISKEKSRSIER